MLGGSSKLAKLAEERRKKAATAQAPAPVPNGALSSLDKLSKTKDEKENESVQVKPQPKKYPIRKKKEVTPPPNEPEPPIEEPREALPDLRASPTEFGRTLSIAPVFGGDKNITMEELYGSSTSGDAFKEPSPDDRVMKAQQHSKSLNK